MVVPYLFPVDCLVGRVDKSTISTTVMIIMKTCTAGRWINKNSGGILIICVRGTKGVKMMQGTEMGFGHFGVCEKEFCKGIESHRNEHL